MHLRVCARFSTSTRLTMPPWRSYPCPKHWDAQRPAISPIIHIYSGPTDWGRSCPISYLPKAVFLLPHLQRIPSFQQAAQYYKGCAVRGPRRCCCWYTNNCSRFATTSFPPCSTIFVLTPATSRTLRPFLFLAALFPRLTWRDRVSAGSVGLRSGLWPHTRPSCGARWMYAYRGGISERR